MAVDKKHLAVLRRLNEQYRSITVFVLAFAIIGSITLLATHATSPNISLETENGTITSPAVSCGTDSTASNSGCVQFKTAGTGCSATIPAYGCYILPGTVGAAVGQSACSSVTTYTVQSPGTNVTINGSTWTWQTYGLRNDDTSPNPLLCVRIKAPLYWNGEGTLTLGTTGHGAIIDDRPTNWTLSFTDGSISGGTTLSSTTPQTFFGAANVVDVVTGNGIPANTTIATIVNSHTVTLSQAATNASGLAITLHTPSNAFSSQISSAPVGGHGCTTRDAQNVCILSTAHMVVTDSTLVGQDQTGDSALLSSNSGYITVLRTEFAYMPQGQFPGAVGSVIDSSWFHDIRQNTNGTAHIDGWFFGPAVATVKRSYLDGNGITNGPGITTGAFCQSSAQEPEGAFPGQQNLYSNYIGLANGNVAIRNQSCASMNVVNCTFAPNYTAQAHVADGHGTGTWGTITGNLHDNGTPLNPADDSGAVTFNP